MLRTLLSLVVVATATSSSPARPVTVAAASDLRQALPELAARFERRTGVRVLLTFGSSGKLATQIENGAPFDAYFSANAAYPRRLEARALTVPGSRGPYAVGRLVLWSGAGIAVERGMAALADPRVKRIAIANPAHAPYGQAAVEALRRAGVYDQVKSRLVYGENISQTAQFAASGSAQVGFLAMSLVTTPALKGGAAWPVPEAWHAPLVQEAVVVRGPGARAAGEFLAYVRGPEGRQVLKSYGFLEPATRRSDAPPLSVPLPRGTSGRLGR